VFFFIQAGFGLLEVGSVRAKNAQNVLLKNLLDAAVAAIAYWAVGFGLAFGQGKRFLFSFSLFLSCNLNDCVVDGTAFNFLKYDAYNEILFNLCIYIFNLKLA
jgi:Amt family ammonium transporter